MAFSRVTAFGRRNAPYRRASLQRYARRRRALTGGVRTALRFGAFRRMGAFRAVVNRRTAARAVVNRAKARGWFRRR